jgi:hypothetical protein
MNPAFCFSVPSGIGTEKQKERWFGFAAFSPCFISLTPSFCWVWMRCGRKNRFNGLPRATETVETVPASPDRFSPS